MLRDTLSEILGERADAELARELKKTVLSFPDVSGAYDLILNNYGPDTFNGSIHVEVPDTYSASDLDELIRSISLAVYAKHHVALTAIGVYSINTKDEHVAVMREAIRKALRMAEDGDIIVLAGKGHETYQEIMGVKRPFDEKVIVSELLTEIREEKEK